MNLFNLSMRVVVIVLLLSSCASYPFQYQFRKLPPQYNVSRITNSTLTLSSNHTSVPVYLLKRSSTTSPNSSDETVAEGDHSSDANEPSDDNSASHSKHPKKIVSIFLGDTFSSRVTKEITESLRQLASP